MVAEVVSNAAFEASRGAGKGAYPPVAVKFVIDAVQRTTYSGPTIYYLVKYRSKHLFQQCVSALSLDIPYATRLITTTTAHAPVLMYLCTL